MQFVLPRLAHPPHPPRPNRKSSENAPTSSISVTLKPMKPSSPTIPLSQIDPAKNSIYDLKAAYSTSSSIPAAKIKILYKKKPVTDSKTVAEVIGGDAGNEVEFSVMVMGGAAAGSTPVTSPPAVAPPSEAEKGLVGEESAVPAAQGPSGKEVVASEEFWEDLKGFVMQRTRDEKEGERLVGLFRSAWEKDR